MSNICATFVWYLCLCPCHKITQMLHKNHTNICMTFGFDQKLGRKKRSKSENFPTYLLVRRNVFLENDVIFVWFLCDCCMILWHGHTNVLGQLVEEQFNNLKWFDSGQRNFFYSAHLAVLMSTDTVPQSELVVFYYVAPPHPFHLNFYVLL